MLRTRGGQLSLPGVMIMVTRDGPEPGRRGAERRAEPPAAARDECALDGRGLTVQFRLRVAGCVTAVDGLDSISTRGETLALVGESGCGKSVTALPLLGLLPHPPDAFVAGSLLDGADLLCWRAGGWRACAGTRSRMVFQEPMTSLNPVFAIGDQIGEALQAQHPSGAREAPAGGRAAGPRSASPTARRARRLSAPALRRHAPARDDRHGDRLPARGS